MAFFNRKAFLHGLYQFIIMTLIMIPLIFLLGEFFKLVFLPFIFLCIAATEKR